MKSAARSKRAATRRAGAKKAITKPLAEVRSCGVLVVIGDPIERFLLMRHKDRWDLPKGHVDPCETDIECALREMWEETGIPIDVIELDPFFRFEHKYLVRSARTGGETKLKTLVVFLARLTCEVRINVTEHPGYQWFEWRPPHAIQEQTVDPLLACLARYLGKASS